MVTFEFTSRTPFTGVVYGTTGHDKQQNTVDQKNKQFDKPLYIVDKNNAVIFKNSDATDHNIYANDVRSGVKFDVGLLPANGEKTLNIQQWPDDVFVRVGCKIHPKMRAYLANIETQNYQALDFDMANKTASTEITLNTDETGISVWFAGYQPLTYSIDRDKPVSFAINRKGKQRGTITITPIKGKSV